MAAKPDLKVVETPKASPTDWTHPIGYYPAPPFAAIDESQLADEWYKRQHEFDLRRKPVDPPKPPSVRARQIEMFKSTHDKIFQSDMKFKKFEFVPDPKEGGIVGRIILEIDADTATFFEPLLHLSNQFVDVLVAGTKVTTKDLS